MCNVHDKKYDILLQFAIEISDLQILIFILHIFKPGILDRLTNGFCLFYLSEKYKKSFFCDEHDFFLFFYFPYKN